MPKRTMTGLKNAHFFFVDIVGLSDPTLPTKIQIKKLTFLYKSIASCAAYKSTPAKEKLILPTGDGVAIGFLQGPNLPLELAIQLHQKIRMYNEERVPSQSLYIRIGIHRGLVFIVKDLKGNNNIWGPGIILARRVMDLGDDGHILLSSNFAKDLLQLSTSYGEYLHELGPHVLKHGVEMDIYSAYSNSGERIFGNEDWPKKLESRIPKLLYPYIEVNITITNADTMLVHYKRVYEIQNATDKPLRTVTHEIWTDVEKKWEDLNVRVIDDEGKELVISEVEFDKPKQKKFATTFVKPLMFGDNRKYVLEYDVEEPDRSFENIFNIRCGKFVVRIDYPLNAKIRTPTAYEVNIEQEKKTKCSIQPLIRPKGKNRTIAEWSVENCRLLQTFRFEW